MATTSELVTQLTIGRGRDVALLDGDSGAAGQTVLSYAHKPAVRVLSDPSGTAITWHWDPSSRRLTLHYTHDGLDQVSIRSGRSRLTCCWPTPAPRVSSGLSTPPAVRCWSAESSLVRTAAILGRRAALTGDTSAAGPITVWAPAGGARADLGRADAGRRPRATAAR